MWISQWRRSGNSMFVFTFPVTFPIEWNNYSGVIKILTITVHFNMTASVPSSDLLSCFISISLSISTLREKDVELNKAQVNEKASYIRKDQPRMKISSSKTSIKYIIEVSSSGWKNGSQTFLLMWFPTDNVLQPQTWLQRMLNDIFSREESYLFTHGNYTCFTTKMTL